jgi:nitrite reductase/ring-hydroxylating ferredoxin subunit
VYKRQALFEPESGRCLAGPCTGKRLEPVPHQERDGSLYLLPAPGAALLH